jgi:hypothetical protein
MQNEVVVILGNMLAEGERKKYYSHLQTASIYLPDEQLESDEVLDKLEIEAILVILPNPWSNTPEPPEPPEINPNIVTGKHMRLKPGTYTNMDTLQTYWKWRMRGDRKWDRVLGRRK